MTLSDPEVLLSGWSRVELVVVWLITVGLLGGALLFGLAASDAGVCGGDGGTPRTAPGSLADSYCDSFVRWDRGVSVGAILAIVFGSLIAAAVVGVVTESRVWLAIVVSAGVAVDVGLIAAAIWLPT